MLPHALFGRTGHDSTRLVFGAAALGSMSQERADVTLAAVESAGINHIDTAASYGASEDLLRGFLSTRRARYFLATKTGERAGGAARAELERSLERMGVDSIDLIQLHNLVESDEWEVAFAPGGAVEALSRARDEGLVRFIGVTGHGVRIPAVHLRSLDHFDFDSVLVPYNRALMRDSNYRADVDRLRERCAARDVAIQTIKSIARGRWRASDDRPRFSWYEPLTDPGAVRRAVHYVLGENDLFLNTTSDATLLPLVIEAANAPIALPDPSEMDADAERFGITPLFDGAALEVI